MTTNTLLIGTEKSRTASPDNPRRTARVKPAADLSRVANREWYPGLCEDCANEPECTFPRSAGQAVISCEEFTAPLTAVSLRVGERPRPDEKERFAVANREWFPGLCMSCQKNDTCTFPKPDGGVFNCDEFE